jgi:2-phosphosulfolactate phosphatase
MKNWLCVVQREHVLRGVDLGIVQTNHGVRSGIQRMSPGDGLVFYSPKTAYPDGDPLRQFTAIGVVADAEPWQSETGLWRRSVEYVSSTPMPIAPLLDVLELTRGNKNWGFIMRRGHVEISQHDFDVVAREMGATSLSRMSIDPHGQSQYQVRFDWGIEGARTIAADADVIVVIDVLSFTTSVDIAVNLGAEVIVSSPRDAPAAAVRHDALLAGPRGGEGLSLAPASITAQSLGAHRRVVLPSLNGSALSAALTGHRAAIVAASLRNRSAVARWVLAQQGDKGDRFVVAVIAAGEKRDDGSTRFAVEDLLGAGAVIDALADIGIDYCSPESAVAAAAFTGLRNATGHLIGASASGRELAEAGHRADIDLAIDLDCSTAVPVLGEFSYRA